MVKKMAIAHLDSLYPRRHRSLRQCLRSRGIRIGHHRSTYISSLLRDLEAYTKRQKVHTLQRRYRSQSKEHDHGVSLSAFRGRLQYTFRPNACISSANALMPLGNFSGSATGAPVLGLRSGACQQSSMRTSKRRGEGIEHLS